MGQRIRESIVLPDEVRETLLDPVRSRRQTVFHIDGWLGVAAGKAVEQQANPAAGSNGAR